MITILEYIRAKKGTIQIHTGSGKSDILLIDKLIHFAGKDVRFHLVHLGNTIYGHFYLISHLPQWIGKGFQVFSDTSLARGFAVRWVCDLAAKDVNLQKSILFASDEPWGSFPSELIKIIDATKGMPKLRNLLLWSNAESIYSEYFIKDEKAISKRI